MMVNEVDIGDLEREETGVDWSYKVTPLDTILIGSNWVGLGWQKKFLFPDRLTYCTFFHMCTQLLD